jgi:hypothetical protein
MQEPVVEPPQEVRPAGNLVDGRVGSAPKPFTTGGDGLGDRVAVAEGHDERLRRSRGQACRGKPGTDPVERSAVNVGTISWSPPCRSARPVAARHAVCRWP